MVSGVLLQVLAPVEEADNDLRADVREPGMLDVTMAEMEGASTEKEVAAAVAEDLLSNESGSQAPTKSDLMFIYGVLLEGAVSSAGHHAATCGDRDKIVDTGEGASENLLEHANSIVSPAPCPASNAFVSALHALATQQAAVQPRGGAGLAFACALHALAMPPAALDASEADEAAHDLACRGHEDNGCRAHVGRGPVVDLSDTPRVAGGVSASAAEPAVLQAVADLEPVVLHAVAVGDADAANLKERAAGVTGWDECRAEVDDDGSGRKHVVVKRFTDPHAPPNVEEIGPCAGDTAGPAFTPESLGTEAPDEGDIEARVVLLGGRDDMGLVPYVDVLRGRQWVSAAQDLHMPRAGHGAVGLAGGFMMVRNLSTCVCVCVCVCHDVTDWEQPTVFKRSDLACCSQFLKLALESDERYCSGDSLKYSMRDRRKNITICYLTD